MNTDALATLLRPLVSPVTVDPVVGTGTSFPAPPWEVADCSTLNAALGQAPQEVNLWHIR